MGISPKKDVSGPTTGHAIAEKGWFRISRIESPQGQGKEEGIADEGDPTTGNPSPVVDPIGVLQQGFHLGMLE
jgi:hypothetical protein